MCTYICICTCIYMSMHMYIHLQSCKDDFDNRKMLHSHLQNVCCDIPQWIASLSLTYCVLTSLRSFSVLQCRLGVGPFGISTRGLVIASWPYTRRSPCAMSRGEVHTSEGAAISGRALVLNSPPCPRKNTGNMALALRHIMPRCPYEDPTALDIV